jgi:GntR family transcriptional regulator of vanillate catabolism
MDLDGFLEYGSRNMAYHQALWKLAKSPILERAIEGVCAIPFASPGAMVFDSSSMAPLYHTRNTSVGIEHHRAILEAIENHEAARAESLAREHARLSRDNVDWALRHLELFPSLPGGHLVVLPGAEKPNRRSRSFRGRAAGNTTAVEIEELGTHPLDHAS